jgi:hypothetical protein
VYPRIRHAGIKINHRINIASPPSKRTNIVNSICLYELSGCSNSGTPRVISPHPFLPGPVEAAVAPQNAAHTAETNVHCPTMLVADAREMVPDNLSAAFEFSAKGEYSGNNMRSNGTRAHVWSRAERGHGPRQCRLPKYAARRPAGSVVVGKLNLCIEPVPFPFPAPQCCAVDAAPSCGYHQR